MNEIRLKPSKSPATVSGGEAGEHAVLRAFHQNGWRRGVQTSCSLMALEEFDHARKIRERAAEAVDLVDDDHTGSASPSSELLRVRMA